MAQMNFFLQKQLIKLSFTYWPLSICKILKKLLGSMQSNECMPFSDPKWSICHEKKFFSTNHYYYFNYLLDLFMCKVQKNSYSRSRVTRMRNFRALNGPFTQMIFFFFRKPVNEPCFFHSFQSSGQGRGSGKAPKFDPKMLKQ